MAKCPECGAENPDDRARCTHCGANILWVLSSQRTSHSRTPPSSPSVASSYIALRGIASLCTIAGNGMLVLAGLGIVGGLIAMSDSFIIGLLIILLSVIIGGLGYIFLRVIAEGISVSLDIEANTRRTALLLEEYLK